MTTSDVPRLYRVILPVKGIDANIKWYEELLGLQGERVAPNRFYLACGPVILALVDPTDEEGTDPRPNQDHVYFAVRDLKPFHERATKLSALDPKMGAIEKRPWGETSFYVRDPLGNPLCFVDETTLFTGTRPPHPR